MVNKCIMSMNDDKVIELRFENGQDFKFDIKGNNVNVGELIYYVSDFVDKIEMDSSQVTKMDGNNQLESYEKNAIKFIKRVCDSFNESFDEVFTENNQ